MRSTPSPAWPSAGLSLDNWPVGTGPFMMTEYTKDRRHVLKRNPNYRGEPYPCDGHAGRQGRRPARRLRQDACPSSTASSPPSSARRCRSAASSARAIYDLEVFERTDTGMSYLVEMQDSEEVRQRIPGARASGSPRHRRQQLLHRLQHARPGDRRRRHARAAGERNRKLRQAISIAIDWEEYSKIFPKKAGETAMSPLPAGIFGSREGTPEGVNPVTHKVVERQASCAARSTRPSS